MLSRQVAVDFIQNKLQVKEVDEKFSTNDGRLRLLNEIMRGLAAKLPYSNFPLIATAPEKRTVQAYATIIDECLNLRGGTCHVLNTFVKVLLRAIGYEATLRGSTLSKAPNTPYHHFIVLVVNVQKPGDMYLCDAGGFYPTLSAVRLSGIEDYTETYSWAFVQARFKIENDTVIRYHRKGKLNDNLGGAIGDEWRPFYVFSTKPEEEEAIRAGLEITYREGTNVSCEKTALACYPDGKSVTIINNLIRVFDLVEDSVEQRTLHTQKELVDAVLQWAPNIKEEFIIASFPNLPPA